MVANEEEVEEAILREKEFLFPISSDVSTLPLRRYMTTYFISTLGGGSSYICLMTIIGFVAFFDSQDYGNEFRVLSQILCVCVCVE